MIYTSCEELPLYNYIRCQVYGNLKHLIIEGEHSQDELWAAWDNIQGEYYTLAQDTLDMYSLSLFFEVIQLENKLEVISASLDILEAYATPECRDLLDILASYGYITERDTNSENYLPGLQKIYKRSKALLVHHKDKVARLKEMREKNQDQKITVIYYDRILSTLSKFYESYLDPKNITVSRYAAMLSQYLNYADQINAKKEHNAAG